MRFATRRQAKDEVMDWIAFYNHRRLHSTLGYTSPVGFRTEMACRARHLSGIVNASRETPDEGKVTHLVVLRDIHDENLAEIAVVEIHLDPVLLVERRDGLDLYEVVAQSPIGPLR